MEKVFKTKTGYCHILPDRIVLTRDGVIGNAAKVLVGNTIPRILSSYSILTCVLFYLAFNKYKEEQFIPAIIFGVLAFSVLLGILSSLNNSAASVVRRESIISVKYKKAILGLFRSYFIVRFKDDSGRIKKRLIMLPGSLSEGPSESRKALHLMQEENLLQ